MYSNAWEYISANTYRLEVPGGWLVQTWDTERNQPVSSIFVPDSHHDWKMVEGVGVKLFDYLSREADGYVDETHTSEGVVEYRVGGKFFLREKDGVPDAVEVPRNLEEAVLIALCFAHAERLF